MFSINHRRCPVPILCLVIALISTTPATTLATEKTQPDQGIDPIMNGFIDLVKNLEDICTTITEAPAVDGEPALSGRIMYSKPENMLSFEVRNNPLLEGMMMIIDNQDEVVYLLLPSSDQAVRMTTEVAAAQLTVMGIGDENNDSLMTAFSQLLPVDILSNFELESFGLSEKNDRSYYLVKMTPNSEDNVEPGEETASPKNYSIAWIDTTNYHLCRLEQYNGDKNIGAFVLTDSSYNTGLSRSDFMAPLQGKSIEDYY